MSYCGHKPGFCGKRADCADTNCEGRPLPTRRSIGLERPWDKEAAQRIGDDPEAFWGMFWFIVFIFCVPVFLAWLAGS